MKWRASVLAAGLLVIAVRAADAANWDRPHGVGWWDLADQRPEFLRDAPPCPEPTALDADRLILARMSDGPEVFALPAGFRADRLAQVWTDGRAVLRVGVVGWAGHDETDTSMPWLLADGEMPENRCVIRTATGGAMVVTSGKGDALRVGAWIFEFTRSGARSSWELPFAMIATGITNADVGMLRSVVASMVGPFPVTGPGRPASAPDADVSECLLLDVRRVRDLRLQRWDRVDPALRMAGYVDNRCAQDVELVHPDPEQMGPCSRGVVRSPWVRVIRSSAHRRRDNCRGIHWMDPYQAYPVRQRDLFKLQPGQCCILRGGLPSFGRRWHPGWPGRLEYTNDPGAPPPTEEVDQDPAALEMMRRSTPCRLLRAWAGIATTA